MRILLKRLTEFKSGAGHPGGPLIGATLDFAEGERLSALKTTQISSMCLKSQWPRWC